jgi:2,4-dienoyl-CoA reductase (NADPH2)
MHTGLEAADSGRPDAGGLAAFYRERVEGGAALVITGGLAVDGPGRGGADYAVLTDPRTVAALREVTDAVHAARGPDGSPGLIAAQLFHAGRYALLDGVAASDGSPEQAVAPSPVAWRAARGAVPRELTSDEVVATVEHFADAARAAVGAGFDAVEVMASEGYLVNQFCSPLTNRRDDEWGGDAARRRAFPVAVVRAVRAAVPGVPVSVRVSGDDLMPGSSSVDDVGALVRALVGTEVEPLADAVSVGVGWHESKVPTVQSAVPHGAWVPVSERVAAAVRASERPGVPVIASNRFTDVRDVEAVLMRGTVDAVALARPFLADPAIVAKSLVGRFDLVTTCLGCDQACIDRSLVGGRVSCLVNPRAGFEARHPLPMLASSSAGVGVGGAGGRTRHLAVVGGGPAGLAAALDAARSGFGVTLFEAADALGGQLALAARIPGKEDYRAAVAGMTAELAALGADVRLATRATIGDLAGFDAVVLASGVRPRRVDGTDGPGITGAERPHVLDYESALLRGVPDGSVAIVGGGGIGVDVATYLVEEHVEARRANRFAERFGVTVDQVLVGDPPQRWPAPRPEQGPAQGTVPRTPSDGRPRPGELVTLLRRSGKFASGVGVTSRWVVLGALREAGVQMLSGVTYDRIDRHSLRLVADDGATRVVDAHTVVVCAGQESVVALAHDLESAGATFEVVGGARDASRVDAVRATAEGLAAARRLLS